MPHLRCYDDVTADRLCQVVTPVGMLGYGFSESHIIAALEHLSTISTPTAIILDSGSTDSGPSKLALGTMSCPRASYERDWGKLIKLSRQYRVPIIISSAGGDGTDEHVDVMLDIIRELAEDPVNSSWKLKVLAIYAGVKHDLVSERLKSGDIVGCGRTVPRLTHKDIEQTVRIVAQMGPEPFVEAMISNPDFDIIIGGRSYDPAPYMAWCAYHALKQKSGSIHTLGKEAMGAFAHMGKILECGGQCATPKSNAAAAMVYQTGAFDIIPLDPNSKCVPYSVAAHVLYENSRPDVLYGPGGYMDLTKVTYEQLEDGRSVRVRGCTFHTSQSQGQRYTVKLEGGKIAGFRTVFIGSYRDPILISQLDNLFARIKGYVKMQHKHVKEFWDIEFHVYGLNEGGTTTSSSNGIFVVGEAIAESQQIASSVASTARIACIHAPYQGQKATAGNFGFGIGGKFEFEVSECTEFSIYHLMFLKDGEEGAVRATSHEVGINNEETAKGLFHWTKTTIGRGEDTGPADTEHTNGINGTNGTNGTTHGAEDPGNKANLPIPAAVASSEPRVLSDIAKVVRSKNAGPYEITLDVIFESPAVYELVKSCGLLSADLIAKLYNISSEDIIWCGYYDVALAFKATIPRKRNGIFTSAGGFMENDVHGSQHHTELLMLDLGSEFIQQLAGLSKQSGTEGPRL